MRKLLWPHIAIIVIAFLMPFAANAATFYVDQAHPSASDANPGTEASPWLTLTFALLGLVAGDTVLVKDGTYADVELQSSGTPGNPITLEAYPGHLATITGRLRIYNKSHIVVRGFQVDGLGIAVRGPGVLDIVIDSNHIIDTVGSGISVWGTPWTDIPVDYDWLGARDIVISNNLLERVTTSGFNEQLTVANGVDNVEVFGNVFFDGGTSPTGGETIDFKEGVTNSSIHHNEIFNSKKLAIYIDGGTGENATEAPASSNIEIYNNYLHDNGGTGIQISTEGAGTVDGIHIHHNRIRGQSWIGILVFIHPDAAFEPHGGNGELRDILIEQNEVRDTVIDDIQMNNVTAFETRIVNNLIDESSVNLKSHPSDFIGDNNGPWVTITPPFDDDGQLPDPPPEVNNAPHAEGQAVRTFRNMAVDITLKASDADGDPLSYDIVRYPRHGTLIGNGSTRTYTPDRNYAGADSFVFLVEDGAGGSDAATVAIEVKRGKGAKWRR